MNLSFDTFEYVTTESVSMLNNIDAKKHTLFYFQNSQSIQCYQISIHKCYSFSGIN